MRPALTAKQEDVYRAFWEAVRDGQPCGAAALSVATGLAFSTTNTVMMRLRALGMIPARPAHDTSVPEEWVRMVPEQFTPGVQAATGAEAAVDPPMAPMAVLGHPGPPGDPFPDHIDPALVGHPFGDQDARIRQLEAELAELRQATEWLAHSADVGELKGGTLTLNCSDMHYHDRGHLVATHRSLEAKVLALIDRFQPRAFQALLNGDIVPGRGIYRNQMLESVLPDCEQQVAAGAWRWREFRDQIVAHLPAGAAESYTVIKGNHDSSEGEDTVMRFVLALRAMAVPARYVGTEWVLNLADVGTYNVLCEHGYGASSFSPTSNKQVLESFAKIIDYQNRGYAGPKAIRRLLHGHSHWLCCGIERAGGVRYDATGGGHRNDRSNIGRNTRPVGWIVYLSPPGSSDILTPIEVVPEKDELRRDLDDPNLSEVNRAEAARCLMAWARWATEAGIVADVRTVQP